MQCVHITSRTFGVLVRSAPPEQTASVWLVSYINRLIAVKALLERAGNSGRGGKVKTLDPFSQHKVRQLIYEIALRKPGTFFNFVHFFPP
jgi:hypothetical protein